MALLILHMSDLHIANDTCAQELNRKKNAMNKFIQSQRTLANHCILLLSGDIAFSGSKSEYAKAVDFIHGVVESLSDAFGRDHVVVVVVPGNHDCDFSGDIAARNLAIKATRDHADLTGQFEPANSVAELMLSVQQEYHIFVTRLASKCNGIRLVSPDKIDKRSLIRMGEHSIFLYAMNTAIASQIQEAENLHFPLSVARSVIEDEDLLKADLAVTVMHHPWYWFRSDQRLEMRDIVGDVADLVFTGHEHTPSARKLIGTDGENEYLEGACFHDDKDPSRSAFVYSILDIASRRIESHTMLLDGSAYREDRTKQFCRDLGPSRREKRKVFMFDPDFLQTLNDAGVSFTHPSGFITLDDIFVYPDLKKASTSRQSEGASVISSSEIVKSLLSGEKVIVHGADQSGKSTLCKQYTLRIRRDGKVPVLVEGASLQDTRPASIRRAISKCVRTQFGDDFEAAFWELGNSSRVLIVDSFADSRFPQGDISAVLATLADLFDGILLMMREESFLDTISKVDDGCSGLLEYDSYQIMQLGHVLRHEIIYRWVTIGSDVNADRPAIDRRVIAIENTISNVLARDMAPSCPISVLLLLQALEAGNPLGVFNASTAMLYDMVVKLNLQKGQYKFSVDAKSTYLAYLAAEMLKSNQQAIAIDTARKWHATYCQEMALTLEFDRLLDEFQRLGVIAIYQGLVQFKYKYLYCYFSAKYIISHFDTLWGTSTFQSLCERLYQEDAANIVMFMCSLSDNKKFLDSVLQQADLVFSQDELCRLEDDVAFAGRLIGPGPSKFVLDKKQDSRQNRIAMLQRADKAEIAGSAADHSATPDVGDQSDKQASVAIISDLNTAVKIVQILGQILRSYYGSIDAHTKHRIIHSSYSLSMRALGAVLGTIRDDEQGMLSHYELWIKTKNPEIESNDARELAAKNVFGLINMITFGMIKHTASAMGIAELAPVLGDVRRNHDTTAFAMIDAAIGLDIADEFPRGAISGVKKRTEKNVLASMTLNALVWIHFYIFPTSIELRQSVCDELGIKLDEGKFLNPRVKRVPNERRSRAEKVSKSVQIRLSAKEKRKRLKKRKRR